MDFDFNEFTDQMIYCNDHDDSTLLNVSEISRPFSSCGAVKKVLPWSDYKSTRGKAIKNNTCKPYLEKRLPIENYGPRPIVPPRKPQILSVENSSFFDETWIEEQYNFFDPVDYEDMKSVSQTLETSLNISQPVKPTIIDKVKTSLTVTRPLKPSTIASNFTLDRTRYNPFLDSSEETYYDDTKPKLSLEKQEFFYETESIEKDPEPAKFHDSLESTELPVKQIFETEWLEETCINVEAKSPPPVAVRTKLPPSVPARIKFPFFDSPHVFSFDRARHVSEASNNTYAQDENWEDLLPPLTAQNVEYVSNLKQASLKSSVHLQSDDKKTEEQKSPTASISMVVEVIKKPPAIADDAFISKTSKSSESEASTSLKAKVSTSSKRDTGAIKKSSKVTRTIREDCSKTKPARSQKPMLFPTKPPLPDLDGVRVTKNSLDNTITIDSTHLDPISTSEMVALPTIDDTEEAFIILGIPEDVCIYAKDYPPALIPPELTQGQNEARIWVSEIYSPYKFWFHLDINDNEKELKELECDLNSFYIEPDNFHNYQMKRLDAIVGHACAAVFENLWYRGEIVGDYNEKNDKVKVFFVDYGTTAFVNLTKVCYLLIEFAGPQRMAYRGRLAFVKPKSRNNKWQFGIPSSDATRCFLNLVVDLELYAKIFAYEEEEKVFHMVLYDVDTESEPVCINERMSLHGYCNFDKTFDFFPHPEDIYPSFEMLEKGIAKSYSTLAKTDKQAFVDADTFKELESKPRQRKIFGVSTRLPFRKIEPQFDYWKPSKTPETTTASQNQRPSTLPPPYDNKWLQSFSSGEHIKHLPDSENLASNYLRGTTYRDLAANPFATDLNDDEKDFIRSLLVI